MHVVCCVKQISAARFRVQQDLVTVVHLQKTHWRICKSWGTANPPITCSSHRTYARIDVDFHVDEGKCPQALFERLHRVYNTTPTPTPLHGLANLASNPFSSAAVSISACISRAACSAHGRHKYSSAASSASNSDSN